MAERPAPGSAHQAYTVEHIGHYARRNVRDGVPMCHCHLDPMVEVTDNQWMCATSVAILAWITARLEGTT